MTSVQHSQTHRTVRLDQFWLEHELWKNPRTLTGLSAKELEELGSEIKAKGMIDPPKVQRVYVVKDGERTGEIADLVIDGQRRILGARDMMPKSTEIPVVDLSDEPVELTPEVAYDLTVKALTSLRHQPLSSYELSAVCESMKAAGKTLDEIGVAVHKHKSWISKMLTARAKASPQLLTKWRKGDITDEAFKELAEADAATQTTKADEVIEAKRSGDKALARVIAKETKATARAEKAEKKAETTRAPDVTKKKWNPDGEHRELFASEADADAHARVEVAKAKAKAIKPPSKLALEEILRMAEKRPPTSDLVKGIVLGTRHALGLIEPDAFGKPWTQYMNRISGKPMKAPKVKAAPKARKPKATPAKAKAKARK